jgi:hypothetical protein
MDFKNKLNQIKVILGLQVNLAQMKLEDGVTTVEAEEFAPEYSIGIVQEDGIVPMPVGEYTLEDGRMLVVAQEGIIAEVKDAESEAPAEDGNVEVEVEAEKEVAPAPKRIVESVSKETFFEEIEKIRAEFTSQIETLKAEKAELEVKLSEQIPAAIVHNPESGTKQEVKFKFAKNEKNTIKNSVSKYLNN